MNPCTLWQNTLRTVYDLYYLDSCLVLNPWIEIHNDVTVLKINRFPETHGIRNDGISEREKSAANIYGTLLLA